MVTVKNKSFEWLRIENDLIKSKRFHIFEPLVAEDTFFEKEGCRYELTGDFYDFLVEFGWAKLFTDHRDSPVVMVYPLKEYRRLVCKDGKAYIGFGDRGNHHVCFEEDSILREGQSKVYLVSSQNAVEICENFSEWLKSAYDWAKSKYSKKKWEKITHGPQPFTREEMSIVDARRLFKWQLIGFAEDGDALFDVENCSKIRLPFLTIGIKDAQNRILIGSAWLDVGLIEPGARAVVKKDCYKDCISPDQLVVFDYPDPIPEKKDAYWEFGRPL